MPAEMPVTRDILNEDAVFILQCLRQNAREGRSMHMMDVRGYLADSMTLEFSDYLKFLRKFGYVELDREEHTLALTPAGEAAAQEDDGELDGRLATHFAEQLAAGMIEIQTQEDEAQALGSLVITGPKTQPPPVPNDVTPRPGPAPMPPDFVQTDSFVPESELVYQRGEAIGQGPLGTVYTGHHSSLGLTVAVKEIRVEAVNRIHGDVARLGARLKEEVGAQARLRHPGIVVVYDLDVTVPQPFAVLELCEGGSVRDRLQVNDGNGLAPEHALQAFGQLLSALTAIHDAGLVHQGLKAENVLFDRHGNAKLADLGFARLMAFDDGDGARQLVVDTGVVSYLAPELMQPRATATPASDVYAAGILLYEMLTGRVPGRRSPEPSKAVQGVPPEIDELFDRMVADRVEDRYASAAEVLEEFQAAFPDGRWGQPGQVWVSTRPPAPPAAKSAPKARKR